MHRRPRTVRYAIYTRQSVDKAEDFSSCEAQFMLCRDFAKETGEPTQYWTGQRFDDEGYSGATLDRPAMRRLRKVIDLNGIDRLYAVRLDRLSRNMLDTVKLLDELDRAKVELRLVHQPELSTGVENRFLRHILASFAEFEREIIASRIAETRDYLKKHGRRIAGKVPYGYDADLTTKTCPQSKRSPSGSPDLQAGSPWPIAFRDCPSHQQTRLADQSISFAAVRRSYRRRKMDRPSGCFAASQSRLHRPICRW